MDSCVMIFISIGIGSIISVGSMILGAWLFSRATAQGGGGFLGEPSGEVFTVETPGDETLFPEDEDENMNEQHVLERTNKFLDALEGKA